jgi:putative peptidoglycan lipid II flippase
VRISVASGRGVLGSAMVVSFATLLSRVSGLARDVLTAMLFGFGREIDAFFLAFTIPNLFRKLFGEGALSSAMIPVLARYKLRGDMEATRRLLGTTALLLALLLGGCAAIGIGIVWLLPSDLFEDAAKFEAFREYLTILLPYVIFICLAALQAGALNTWNRFGLPAITPAIANVIWVAVLAGIWFSPLREQPHIGVLVMAAGVLLSGFAQWALQVPALRGASLFSGPRWSLNEPGLRETFRAMAPMLFALAVFQVNTFMDQVLAEWLVAGDGAVASYGYAMRLFQFPLGLVGVAVGTAMFPLMAKFAAAREFDKLTAGLLNSCRLIAFVALPAAEGLAALSWPITALLFDGPKSTPEMLARSALVAALLCISLPIVSVLSLLTKAFYALGDTRTPTRLALLSVAINLVANIILLQTPLLEAGLAIGTAISGAVNLAMLALALRKKLRGTLHAEPVAYEGDALTRPMTRAQARQVPLSILRAMVVSGVMAAGAWAAEHFLRQQFDRGSRWVLVLSVSAGIAAGMAIYVALSAALRAPELKQSLNRRRRA